MTRLHLHTHTYTHTHSQMARLHPHTPTQTHPHPHAHTPTPARPHPRAPTNSLAASAPLPSLCRTAIRICSATADGAPASWIAPRTRFRRRRLATAAPPVHVSLPPPSRSGAGGSRETTLPSKGGGKVQKSGEQPLLNRPRLGVLDSSSQQPPPAWLWMMGSVVRHIL